MMCDRIRSQVYELVDGTLASAEADELRAHVRECTACGERLRQWERIREGFAYVPRAEMSRSVAAEAARKAGEPRRLASLWGLRPVFAGAAALAVVAVALVAGLPRSKPDAVTQPPRRPPVAAAEPFDTPMFAREHAMFALGGSSLDRDLWTVAVTDANRDLLGSR